MNKLEKYSSMRDSEKTPEPFTSKDIDPKRLAFVVQKHAATALHYDFRLELDGVMPSWAVPKGPSLDNTVKRLAMKTEDHPLDYRHFEGIIPEGQYGSGKVIIWDQGWYLPEIELEQGVRKEVIDKSEGEKVIGKGLEKGEIKFFLYGTKLKGSFALVKTRGFGGRENSWLLIKHADAFVEKGYDAANYKTSTVSGKSLEELAS